MSEPNSSSPAPSDIDPPSERLPSSMGGASSLERAGFKGGVQIDDLWARFEDEDAPVSLTESSGERHVAETLTGVSGDEKYAVLGEIAKGGMGKILRAVDRDIRRPVAMKVMINHADEEHRARFVEEAQITGQLEHPNIIPIHEIGVDENGRLFFTMKMVRGRSLAEILDDIRDNPKRGNEKYPLSVLLHALVHACNAIAFAHSRGVVHRDLKPANIMVGEYGEVQVMDWGLAKIGATLAFRQRDAEEHGGTYEMPVVPSPPAVRERRTGTEVLREYRRIRSYRHDSSLLITKDGTIAGTPAYMSPEQARGEIDHIDERSDVYALGSILYEILTLFPPVVGATDSEFLENAKAGAILPPQHRAPRRPVPKPLRRIAMQALAYDPKDRYQTAEAFRLEIAQYMEDLVGAARGEPVWREEALRSRRAVKALFFVVLLLLAVLLLGYAGTRVNSVHLARELEHVETELIDAQAERDAALHDLREARTEGLILPGTDARKNNMSSTPPLRPKK